MPTLTRDMVPGLVAAGGSCRIEAEAPAKVAIIIPNTRRSHSSWNTGSFGSGRIGPRPCMPPRS